MISSRALFLTVFGSFAAMALMYFLFSFTPHARRIDRAWALNDTLSQATQGANPAVNGALLQTYACVQKGYTDAARRTFDQGDQRLTVWDPCVQQGVMRLDQGGFHADVPEFHQRLTLLDAAVSPL